MFIMPNVGLSTQDSYMQSTAPHPDSCDHALAHLISRGLNDPLQPGCIPFDPSMCKKQKLKTSPEHKKEAQSLDMEPLTSLFPRMLVPSANLVLCSLTGNHVTRQCQGLHSLDFKNCKPQQILKIKKNVFRVGRIGIFSVLKFKSTDAFVLERQAYKYQKNLIKFEEKER